MSINLANNRDCHRIANELKERAGGVPNILLLQEVGRRRGAEASVAEELAAILGMHVAFAAPEPGPTNIGVAILSRWPLTDMKVHRVPRFYRLLKFRPRLSLAVTTHSPAGSIRVWTTHLDTRINVHERIEQLKSILAETNGFRGPCIIGGDLNTLRLGWLLHAFPYPTGNAHAQAVTELMSQYGFRTPFKEDRPTFDRFRLQLDWVYLRGLAPVGTGIVPLAFSDHHAVWTEFLPETPVAQSHRSEVKQRSR
jgi:endonuclease/exonuclease/phosphatase family metal-dependent hydrolase